MPDEAKSSDPSQIRKVSPSLDARKDVLSVKFEPKPRIVVSTINVSPVFERKKQELPLCSQANTRGQHYTRFVR